MDPSHSIDMMLKYPSILADKNGTSYRGYLPVEGTDYETVIERHADYWDLQVTPQLEPFREEIAQFQATHPNIITFLDGLANIIKANPKSKFSIDEANKMRHILSEYVELQQFYINLERCSISHDLSQIDMSLKDESGRVHYFVINCELTNSTGVFQPVEHSLPEKKESKLFTGSNSLKDLYEKFIAVIGKLQNFFDLMDVLDANCWILDPEKPSRKECFRRVGFDSSISMLLTIDPWNSTQVPEIKFLGPERLIDTLREKVAKNLIKWDPNYDDFLGEILKIVELDSFPPRPMETNEDLILCNVGECCICFSSRLNDKLPEIICPNRSCEQFFHIECLYQWLVSVNAKQSFKELHGQCPNCEKDITCPDK